MTSPHMILHKHLGRELRRRVGWVTWIWLSIILWWRERDECPECEGSGNIKIEFGFWDTDCPTCDGKGYVEYDDPEKEARDEERIKP